MFADVLHVFSNSSSYKVLLPDKCKVGHHIIFLGDNSYQIDLITKTNTTINNASPPFFIPPGTTMVDCRYLGRQSWICSKVNKYGRTHAIDQLNVKHYLQFYADDANNHTRKLRIGANNPTGSNLILLPDVSGTVITTGNLIDINGTATSIRIKNDFTVNGNAIFGDTEYDTITIKGQINGREALIFNGNNKGPSIESNSSRKTIIQINEPTGENVLTLPSVSGTILTTGNLMDINGTIRSLSINKDLVVMGKSVFGETWNNTASSNISVLPGTTVIHGPMEALNNVVLGKDEESKITISGIIRYENDLRFSKNLEGSAHTSFRVDEIQENHTLIFPNVDGTVITTGNQHDIIIEKAMKA